MRLTKKESNLKVIFFAMSVGKKSIPIRMATNKKYLQIWMKQKKLWLLNLAPLYKCFIFRESNVIINVAYLIIVVKSIFYCQNEFSTFPTVMTRVSVQGVESLGGHFATLCREFDFDEVKKIYYYFSKRKGKYFYTFNHFHSEKSSTEQNSTNLLLWPPICNHLKVNQLLRD